MFLMSEYEKKDFLSIIESTDEIPEIEHFLTKTLHIDLPNLKPIEGHFSDEIIDNIDIIVNEIVEVTLHDVLLSIRPYFFPTKNNPTYGDFITHCTISALYTCRYLLNKNDYRRFSSFKFFEGKENKIIKSKITDTNSNIFKYLYNAKLVPTTRGRHGEIVHIQNFLPELSYIILLTDKRKKYLTYDNYKTKNIQKRNTHFKETIEQLIDDYFEIIDVVKESLKKDDSKDTFEKSIYFTLCCYKLESLFNLILIENNLNFSNMFYSESEKDSRFVLAWIKSHFFGDIPYLDNNDYSPFNEAYISTARYTSELLIPITEKLFFITLYHRLGSSIEQMEKCLTQYMIPRIFSFNVFYDELFIPFNNPFRLTKNTSFSFTNQSQNIKDIFDINIEWLGSSNRKDYIKKLLNIKEENKGIVDILKTLYSDSYNPSNHLNEYKTPAYAVFLLLQYIFPYCYPYEDKRLSFLDSEIYKMIPSTYVELRRINPKYPRFINNEEEFYQIIDGTYTWSIYPSFVRNEYEFDQLIIAEYSYCKAEGKILKISNIDSKTLNQISDIVYHISKSLYCTSLVDTIPADILEWNKKLFSATSSIDEITLVKTVTDNPVTEHRAEIYIKCSILISILSNNLSHAFEYLNNIKTLKSPEYIYSDNFNNINHNTLLDDIKKSLDFLCDTDSNLEFTDELLPSINNINIAFEALNSKSIQDTAQRIINLDTHFRLFSNCYNVSRALIGTLPKSITETKRLLQTAEDRRFFIGNYNFHNMKYKNNLLNTIKNYINKIIDCICNSSNQLDNSILTTNVSLVNSLNLNEKIYRIETKEENKHKLSSDKIKENMFINLINMTDLLITDISIFDFFACYNVKE